MSMSMLAPYINLKRLCSLKRITLLINSQTVKTVYQTKQLYSYKQQVLKTLVSHSSLSLLKNIH